MTLDIDPRAAAVYPIGPGWSCGDEARTAPPPAAHHYATYLARSAEIEAFVAAAIRVSDELQLALGPALGGLGWKTRIALERATGIHDLLVTWRRRNGDVTSAICAAVRTRVADAFGMPANWPSDLAAALQELLAVQVERG